MKKIYLLYGSLCYLVLVATVAYAIGFFGNAELTNTLDGIPARPLLSSILLNASLLMLWFVQRNAFSNASFQQWMRRKIPLPLHQCTHVMLSCLYLLFLMWLWQPVGGLVWSVENSIAQTILTILYLAGWGTVIVGSFLANHFEWTGLRRLWAYYKNKNLKPRPMQMPGFYKLVRHQIFLGMFLILWSTPKMTIVHLLLAILLTGYYFVFIRPDEQQSLQHIIQRARVYRRALLIAFISLKKRTGRKIRKLQSI